MKRDEKASELGDSPEEGKQPFRVGPAGIGKEGEGNVKAMDEANDLLKFRVQCWLSAGDFQSGDMKLELSEDYAPLTRQKRRCTI